MPHSAEIGPSTSTCFVDKAHGVSVRLEDVRRSREAGGAAMMKSVRLLSGAVQSKFAGVLLMAGIIAAGAIAEATIPGVGGVIDACMNTRTGALRVIDALSHSCKRTETPLRWNQQGPPGAPLSSFDDLNGLPCVVNDQPGTIVIAYAGSNQATITCATSGTGGGGTGKVVINEFTTGSPGASANEFVEIFNPGASPVDISGFRLVYRSPAGTSDVLLATVPQGTTLPAGGFYLFGGSAYQGPPAPDQTFSPGTGLSATGGGLGLRDRAGALVDSVGYGTATNAFVETAPAPAPSTSATQSAGRHPDGLDTEDNASDFVLAQPPTPKAANVP